MHQRYIRRECFDNNNYYIQIKAAVALAIGAKDKRCPPSQAKELYELLHAQGKDVR